MAIKSKAQKEKEALELQLAEMKAKLGKKPKVSEEPKRGPGRPKGSGKKAPIDDVPAEPKRGPGRPKGSGKKPKVEVPEEAAPVIRRRAAAPAQETHELWSLREDGKVAHNGRVLQSERCAHYVLADGGAVWIVGRTVENRSVFHATGIDGAGNALTPATFAGSPEVVCLSLNAFMSTLQLAA